MCDESKTKIHKVMKKKLHISVCSLLENIFSGGGMIIVLAEKGAAGQINLRNTELNDLHTRNVLHSSIHLMLRTTMN